jgi:hypothetical protein
MSSPTVLFEGDKPAPCCGAPANAATDMRGEPRQIEPGDLSICFNCGSWLCLADKEGTMRRALPVDLATLTPEDLDLASRARLAVFIRGVIWTKETGWLNENH